MTIEYSPKFLRLWGKLPDEIKELAKEKIIIFQKNPFDPRLRTHKLTGQLRKYWAFWVKYKYRIIFSFLNGKTARFHVVGDHSIYD